MNKLEKDMLKEYKDGDKLMVIFCYSALAIGLALGILLAQYLIILI